MPRYVDVLEFEATCLELIDELAATGDYVVITKGGQPFVDLTPYQPLKTSENAKTEPGTG